MMKIRSQWFKGWLHSSYLLLLLRLFAGITFVYSAATKLPLQSQFVDIVKEYHLLPDPLAVAYGMALPWIEFLIGIYLVLGLLVRPGAIVTILLGISFMIANISGIVRGLEYCGSCFGEAFPLSASHAIVLDCFLILAAVILLTTRADDIILSLDRWLSKRDSHMSSPAERTTGEEI